MFVLNGELQVRSFVPFDSKLIHASFKVHFTDKIRFVESLSLKFIQIKGDLLPSEALPKLERVFTFYLILLEEIF